MHDRLYPRIIAVSVLIAGALTASAALAQAPAAQTGGQQIAQNSRDEYLPPWQRGKSEQNSSDDDDAPQQISPQQGGNNSRYDNSAGGTRGDVPPSRDYTQPPSQAYAPPPAYEQDTYSSNEIVGAGERFFGGVTKGLGQVIEYSFSKQGRPNGYILGEEAGGAIIAGLRYGEGTLYTKNAGVHRVYWQGPSFGYDFGAEGSKTLILAYNLRTVDQIYDRFAGVDGSAYFVGGVGVTFQTHDDVVLAPIRSGVGLRLGANVGYLKYTRTPTWNPF